MTYKRCIYFLIKNSRIIYIGQTKNLKDRLSYWRSLKYTSFRAIKCDADKANHYEYRWIKKFQPKFNDIHYHPHNWRASKNTRAKPKTRSIKADKNLIADFDKFAKVKKESFNSLIVKYMKRIVKSQC